MVQGPARLGNHVMRGGKIAIKTKPSMINQTNGQDALNISDVGISGTALLNANSV